MPKFLLFLLFLPLAAAAQDTGQPLNSLAYPLLERYQIRGDRQGPIHPEVKFFSRSDVALETLHLDSLLTNQDARTRFNLHYLVDDNNEWIDTADARYRTNTRPMLKWFYRTPANFFQLDVPHFHLRLNPRFHFSAGKEQDVDTLRFVNERGFELRGSIDDRVYFYTSLLETQARFPTYVRDRIERYQAVPGAGFFKNFKDHPDAYDYNVAEAYLGFRATSHIQVQFGHGRHFIGNGYRSLFLSDAGNYAFFLKLNTRIWRFHYQNLFQELSPESVRQATAGRLLQKKYMALHYLHYRVTPTFGVGVFEATVFHRNKQFELQYLNPLIFYRTVEGMIGSPDNVLLGFDARWDAFRRVRFYGQFLLDEFVFKALWQPEEKGWWGNKYAFQFGIKWPDVLPHLDLQAEYNAARPYTYSHNDSLSNYTHYRQPLAHPLWANFREAVVRLRYQPIPRLFVEGRIVHADLGENAPDANWGADPLLPNDTRVSDYGNFTGQGVTANLQIAALDLSYMLYHNLFADIHLLLRRFDSQDNPRDQTTRYLGVGLRYNVWPQNADF